MDKTIHTAEYATMLTLLRETRQAAGVTQVQLAERLDETQSQISKLERGEVRIDVIELRTILLALGVSLPAFMAKLEERLAGEEGGCDQKEPASDRE
jgi:transcriptional regulator with XRE-family HTH domain